MNNNIKERPILFNGAMVRAILEGRKTQTRRVIKQAVGPSLSVGCEDGIAELSWLYGDGPGYDVHETTKQLPCPFGKPGEGLWVRETFGYQVRRDACGGSGEFTVYRASNPDAVRYTTACGKSMPVKWKPSIHMPRHCSRILLEITGVRVERLQDISEEYAKAEGVDMVGGPASVSPYRNYRIGQSGEMSLHCSCARRSFMTLWESINGAGSWEANPCVWVVSFRRIES